MAEFVEEHDCIIVGAGLSGLQCANSLVYDHGIDPSRILLLDAHNYVGGRVKQTTDFVKGFKIDLGAELLHGTNTKLTEFARKTAEPIKEIFVWAHGDGGPLSKPVNSGYGLYFVSNKESTKRLIKFDDPDPEFVKVNEALWELARMNEEAATDSQSVLDYLKSKGINKEMIAMAGAGFSNTFCCDSEDLSLKQTIRWSHLWHNEDADDGDFMFENSYSCLIDHLRKDLNITLNTPIASVDYSEGFSHNSESSPDDFAGRELVTLTAVDGRVFRSRCVVVTASPQVLLSDLITFNPPLPPSKMRALNSIHMKRAMKVILKFKARPWPKHLQGMIMAGDNCPVPEAWFRDIPLDNPEDEKFSEKGNGGNRRRSISINADEAVCIVTGFACASFADKLAAMPREELFSRFLAQLDDAFGQLEPRHMSASAESEPDGRSLDELPMPSSVFLGGIVQDWQAQPYIGGGYCCARPGTDISSCRHLAEMLCSGNSGAVFFAGEATNVDRPGGTAHAAMETGERAAREVASFLVRC